MENVVCVKEAIEMCDNDEEFMKEMVALMRDDVSMCLNLLPRAFTENDPTQTRELAHRVKGQAANMAAKDLWGKAKRVEDAAKLGFCTRTEYLHLILSMQEFVRFTRDL
ncbi:unnamed protein product [Ectocarpus sp. 12 AP-2014]